MFPSIVLVPGLWEPPAAFDPLRESLTKLGLNATDIHVAGLQFTGTLPPNTPTLEDDIAGIRAVIEPLVAAGKRVVVVGHSAGAFLGAAATKDLEVGFIKGGTGGVERFVFVAGGVVPAGTLHPAPPFGDFQGDKMFCKNPDQALWNDVPAEVRAKYEPFAKHHPSAYWGCTIPYAGWERVPSTYLVCENDQLLPVPFQEGMAGAAKSTVVKVPLGHMAILSGPDLVAEEVVKVIRATA